MSRISKVSLFWNLSVFDLWWFIQYLYHVIINELIKLLSNKNISDLSFLGAPHLKWCPISIQPKRAVNGCFHWESNSMNKQRASSISISINTRILVWWSNRLCFSETSKSFKKVGCGLWSIWRKPVSFNVESFHKKR